MKIGKAFGKTMVGKWAIKGALNALSPSSTITTMSSTYISKDRPVWRNFSQLSYLLDCYYENPVVQATINIKARAFSNMRLFVKDISTGDMVPLHEYDGDGGALKKLLERPNPLQSTFEWLRQLKVNFEVFGNSYVHASVPVGFEKRFEYGDIMTMNNLPSYGITPVLTGNWLTAQEKDEIIKEYELVVFNGKKRRLSAYSIFHCNNENIRFDEYFTQGVSDLISLKKPISNIDKAYESRNVMIRKRGAIGAWTPDKTDGALGTVPLTDTEKEDAQKEFEKYGLLEDQWQQVITPVPLKWQSTASKAKDLMLFEEIESDAIAIANAKGVPELLVKYYIKGGTFNNLDASEKRLYDSTIIPEANDFMIGLNHFLKTREKGIELVASFDHLNILQVNKKDEAETNKIKQETALAAFKIGAITYGQYLQAIGMPDDKLIGDLRIWDLSDSQLSAINGTNTGKSILEQIMQ